MRICQVEVIFILNFETSLFHYQTSRLIRRRYIPSSQLFMNHPKNQSTTQFSFGPIKIKDGLFMGDELAAKDIQFIISNKVTHIINTVVHKIPNLWENFCIHYLSIGWTEKQTNIFDKKNNALNTIFNFIEEAIEKGQSCLIHSINGKSRACTVIVAYLIKKYQWSLGKCLEFIDSRKSCLQIRMNYLQQLQLLQSRMKKQFSLNDKWDLSKNQDEKLINNTYRNSLSVNPETLKIQEKKAKTTPHIQWKQQSTLITTSLNCDVSQIIKERKNVKPILKSHIKEDYQFYRSPKSKYNQKDSDSLQKILFESTKKKKNEKTNEDKTQRRTSRKTTAQICAGSLQKKQSQKSQNDQCLTFKKIQHYNQVLASYHHSYYPQLKQSMNSRDILSKKKGQRDHIEKGSVDKDSRSNSDTKKMLWKKTKRRPKINSSHSPKSLKGKKQRYPFQLGGSNSIIVKI